MACRFNLPFPRHDARSQMHHGGWTLTMVAAVYGALSLQESTPPPVAWPKPNILPLGYHSLVFSKTAVSVHLLSCWALTINTTLHSRKSRSTPLPLSISIRLSQKDCPVTYKIILSHFSLNCSSDLHLSTCMPETVSCSRTLLRLLRIF